MNDQPQPTTQYERVFLDELSGPQLVAVYNQLVAEKSKVKKFETLGKGMGRVLQALSDAGLNGNNLVRSGDSRGVIVLTNQQVAEYDPTRVPPSLMTKPLTDAEIAERQAAERKGKAKQKRADKKIFKKTRKRSYLKQTGISKKDKVLTMITRKGGATAAEMVEETKWLPHTLRAQITRHRQAGHKIVANRKDGVTTYTIA